ncbi:hypothetical protein MASSI9I_10070 [Massilia sp. 9I]|nr:hypothetical protein MASSI9I_10070 [Massilia sp. 9I]
MSGLAGVIDSGQFTVDLKAALWNAHWQSDTAGHNTHGP